MGIENKDAINKLVFYINERLSNNRDGIKINAENLLKIMDMEYVNNVSRLAKDLKRCLEPRGYYVRYDPSGFTFDILGPRFDMKLDCEKSLIREEQKRENSIKKIIDHFEIDDCDYVSPGEYDFDDIVEHIVSNQRRVHNICNLLVEKQDEILFENEILISPIEIMKTAIIKGLERFI